ncbi:MAG: nuclear transport factor 2 family protein [Gammaproteobacteria bacterium]|jgi:hypothetical protein|nr:nuclear transport factor 2 family protein [Gammaproteobacteria bacterium]MBT4492338.1 nuclear transport factor 2 family protein [Gammaproteobacteria bacterium]MBT7371413.1 nuclear transport factor 2 family protein [Gammaproteobacteria bacterium]
MVEDELAIRHLVAAYADGVNRRDQELWASTWSESSSWTLPGTTVEGKEAVVGLWVAAMGGLEFVVQLVHQGTLEINGDKATGRWYLTEHLRAQGASDTRTSVGTYKDEYVRENGSWLFANRVYEVLYSDEG